MPRIGSIYDCAFAPDRWGTTLGEIKDAFASRAVTLSLHDLRKRQVLINEAVGLPAGGTEFMAGVRRWDHVFPHAHASPLFRDLDWQRRTCRIDHLPRDRPRWDAPAASAPRRRVAADRKRLPDPPATGRHGGGVRWRHTGRWRRGTAIARAFGLTAAETRLLDRLLSGRRLAGAAADLGIAAATARTHLDNIFMKTGASRQVELKQVALRAQPPVGACAKRAE